MNNTKSILLGVLSSSALFLVGCSTNSAVSPGYTDALLDLPGDDFVPERQGFTDDASREAILATQQMKQMQDENYQVGPDDVLEISIFEWQAEGAKDTLNLRVSKAGEIAMPGLGAIQVAGMSVEDIQQYLVNELQEAGIIEVNPRVGVSISEFRSKRVSVVGAVLSPGVYALTENVAPLMEIISLAGGPSGAAGSSAYILRTSKNRESPQQIEVDLNELFRTGASDLDAILSDGDTVYIPKASRVFLYGEVTRPGGLDMPEAMTLIQAIAESGGLTDQADKSILRVERRIGPGKTKSIPINLAAVEAGNGADIILQAGDVVHVPVNESKKTIRETFDFFRGIFSASYRIN